MKSKLTKVEVNFHSVKRVHTSFANALFNPQLTATYVNVLMSSNGENMAAIIENCSKSEIPAVIRFP